MDPVVNPYTPNAGAEPAAIVGRDDQLKSFDLLLKRLERGRTEQSMIITGLRGVGKTVLLNQFNTKALTAGWVVVELEVSKHDDSHFRRILGEKLRTCLLELSPRARWDEKMTRAARILKSFTLEFSVEGTVQVGLDVEAAEGKGDHGDLSLDLADLLVAIGEAAAEQKKGVVLLFDEIQFLNKNQLEALIASLHKLVQRKLPVTLVGAGLPQIAELAGDAKSYAERLFKFPSIGNLDDGDAKEALTEPAKDEGVWFDNAALNEAVRITGGYPYFIQELGSAVWLLTDNNPIKREDVLRAEEVYLSKLDSSFFRVRLDRATSRQRDYLRAMAELGDGPKKAQDVAQMMGKESKNVAPLRSELINMGLLFTPEHGYASFTVPHFDQYMKRAIPEYKVPTKGD